MSTLQIVIVSIGGLAMVLGALIAILRIRTIFFGKSAQGRVVGQSESTSTSRSGGSTQFVKMYAPIVEFTHEGKKFKFTSTLGLRSQVPTGSPVTVRYLPADPGSTAEISSPGRMWGFPIMALFAGAVFVVLGLAMGK